MCTCEYECMYVMRYCKWCNVMTQLSHSLAGALLLRCLGVYYAFPFVWFRFYLISYMHIYLYVKISLMLLLCCLYFVCNVRSFMLYYVSNIHSFLCLSISMCLCVCVQQLLPFLVDNFVCSQPFADFVWFCIWFFSLYTSLSLSLRQFLNQTSMYIYMIF